MADIGVEESQKLSKIEKEIQILEHFKRVSLQKLIDQFKTQESDAISRGDSKTSSEYAKKGEMVKERMGIVNNNIEKLELQKQTLIENLRKKQDTSSPTLDDLKNSVSGGKRKSRRRKHKKHQKSKRNKKKSKSRKSRTRTRKRKSRKAKN